MINSKYEQKLDEIDQLLEEHHYSEAKEELSQLEKVKPVRLRWNVLFSKYYFLSDDYYGFRECLDDKWWANYSYDGLDEAFALYERLWEKYPNKKERLRNQYARKLVKYIGTDKEQELQLYRRRLEKLSANFYSNGTDEILVEIEKDTYTIGEMVWNYMIRIYFQLTGKGDQLPPEGEWVSDLGNMGYLKERIEESDSTFVLVSEKGNAKMCIAMARLLRLLEKNVYLLLVPEEHIDCSEATAEKSIQHQDVDLYKIKKIPTYYIENKSDQKLDNRAAVISYLMNQEKTNGLVTVIGSGNILDDLEMEHLLKKNFSRFNLCMGDIYESNFSVGWAGDYLSYISKIYNGNVKNWMHKPSRYQYSIVIPARNSAENLRHTLETCLELDYPAEKYEIVISDNSTNNNDAVYKLCQEQGDPRINYYRTPRDLQLSKSFEYAFLQARGDFIISIGSDDAVLPWALKVLDEIQQKYPQEEIIQWERGFYAWPGFNGGQENQFVIPRAYKRGEYQEYYKARLNYLAEILNDPKAMYGLPALYINSGFKRTYMKKILEKTGRLWDGVCQDLYMGVINTAINDQILNLRYPLTIAGMTSMSVGAACVDANTDDQQRVQFNDDIRKTNNIGGFSMSMTERLMPELRSDVSSLYNSLLRAVARGVLPDEYLWEVFDWKKMFLNSIAQLDVRDVEYDKLIQSARYTASWHGEAFLQWFDEEIYKNAMSPRIIDEEKLEQTRKQKTYQEGRTENGGIIADASKYGVMNSYEATKLFGKLSGLSVVPTD